MLPKADPKRSLPNEPIMRAIEYCPDCKQYISPGFRTDMCPFCFADFSELPEYKQVANQETAAVLYYRNPDAPTIRMRRD